MADKKQDGGADPQPAAPAAPVQSTAAEETVDVAAIAAALGQETPEAVSTPAAQNSEPNEPDPVEPAVQDEPEAGANAEAVHELSGKGRERVEKRINQLTAQKKEAQELAETERLAREAAEARQAELEARLAEVQADGGAGTRPARTESSELLAAESEADIAAYEARLAQYEDFIDEHIDEGYTPDDPEKTAYTPAQLRKMLRQVQRERSVLIPQAKEVLKQRQTSNAEAKTLYPDLFKTNSEMSVQAAAILARVPGLKQLPNVMLLLGDALSKAAERAAPKPKAVEKKSPPVIPAPAATPKPASSAMQPVKPKIDMARVQSSGGSLDAIAEGIAALGLG